MTLDPDMEARVRLGEKNILCPHGCGGWLRVWSRTGRYGTSLVSCGSTMCVEERINRMAEARRRELEDSLT